MGYPKISPEKVEQLSRACCPKPGVGFKKKGLGGTTRRSTLGFTPPTVPHHATWKTTFFHLTGLSPVTA